MILKLFIILSFLRLRHSRRHSFTCSGTACLFCCFWGSSHRWKTPFKNIYNIKIPNLKLIFRPFLFAKFSVFQPSSSRTECMVKVSETHKIFFDFQKTDFLRFRNLNKDLCVSNFIKSWVIFSELVENDIILDFFRNK